MKTNLTEIEKLNRSLWTACNHNIGIASAWRVQALEFINTNGANENHFVASAHPANRQKAVAAFRLALAEAEEAYQAKVAKAYSHLANPVR